MLLSFCICHWHHPSSSSLYLSEINIPHPFFFPIRFCTFFWAGFSPFAWVCQEFWLAQLCRRMGFQSRVRRLHQDGRHQLHAALSGPRPRPTLLPSLPVESGNSRVSAKQRATRAGPATELSGASRGPSESEAEAALARPVFFRADWGIGRVIGLSRLAERPLRQKSRSKAGDRRRRKTWRQRHFRSRH